MAGSDPQTLYTLGSGGKLHKTVNGAASWTLMASGACDGQCTYNLTLDIDPTDPTHILIGAIRPWESNDSGVNRTPLTTTWGSGQTVHQDIHVVRFSRVNPLRFWIAGDGGIWRTDTAGFNYVNLNWTLILTQFYDVAVDPGQPGRIFGGAQDNSSSARFGANQWNVTAVTGDGFMNAIDPVTLTRVFQTSYPASGTPSVYRSTSSGNPNTFSRLATFGIVAGEPFPWVTPLTVMPRPDLRGLALRLPRQHHPAHGQLHVDEDLAHDRQRPGGVGDHAVPADHGAVPRDADELGRVRGHVRRRDRARHRRRATRPRAG